VEAQSLVQVGIRVLEAAKIASLYDKLILCWWRSE